MWHKALVLLTALWLGFSATTMAQPQPAQRVEHVSLQLKWYYQFEYAGFIMAKEKGFYAEAGLDVDLRQRKPDSNPVAEVMSGRATYGIHNASLVIVDHKIQPLVLLATYLHRSPLVYATRKGITSPYDLRGKTIMISTRKDHFNLLTMLLEQFDINCKNSNLITNSARLQDFIDGKVDAVPVFLSDQVFELKQKNVPFDIIDPHDYGFRMAGAINLFTRQQEVDKHPQRTHRFVAASNRGWEYALDHIDETVQLIHEKYAPHKSLAALGYEAHTIAKLFQRDQYPIGAIDHELTLKAYRHALETERISADQDLDFYLYRNDILDKRAVDFSDAEIDYLRRKRRITMCIDPDWMPFEKLDNGRHIGIAADFIALFQQKLPIPITLLPTRSWQESLDYAKARKCDILSMASKTPSRIAYLDFTTPYITIPLVIATRTSEIYVNDLATLKDKPVGIVCGYAVNEELHNTYPGMHIVDVDSASDGMHQVENGKLFAYIDNLFTIADQIQKNYIGSIKISGRLDNNFSQVNLCVATRNDEPELLSIFDKLVRSITPAQRQAILNKWTPVASVNEFDYEMFWSLLGIMGFICAAFLLYFHQLRKYNCLLLKLSKTDKLTDLYNRSKLDQILREQSERFHRYGTACGIAILDIDHFKRVNDNYGHQTGDKVLQQFATILRSNIRTTDVVGRWGGEEFLLIAPSTTSAETTRLAEKLLQQVRDTDFAEIGHLTASAGVSSIEDGQDITATLRLADNALYVAKRNGRDQVFCADPLNPPAPPQQY